MLKFWDIETTSWRVVGWRADWINPAILEQVSGDDHASGKHRASGAEAIEGTRLRMTHRGPPPTRRAGIHPGEASMPTCPRISLPLGCS
jgi:hypothetical protein